jgi:hypothetical protein
MRDAQASGVGGQRFPVVVHLIASCADRHSSKFRRPAGKQLLPRSATRHRFINRYDVEHGGSGREVRGERRELNSLKLVVRNGQDHGSRADRAGRYGTGPLPPAATEVVAGFIAGAHLLSARVLSADEVDIEDVRVAFISRRSVGETMQSLDGRRSSRCQVQPARPLSTNAPSRARRPTSRCGSTLSPCRFQPPTTPTNLQLKRARP